MHLIKGHITSLLYFALTTSSFTVSILLNILYSCLLSGSGNKKKKKQAKTKWQARHSLNKRTVNEI